MKNLMQGNPVETGSRRGMRTALVATMMMAAQIIVLISGSPASAQTTLVVTSTGDQSDANPGDGVCAASNGTCTLRAAVEEANALRGPNTITFGIAGSGVKTITIEDTLELNDQSGGTTINGYTQRGAAPNTDPLASNAKIRVEITTTSTPWPMILVQSPANELKGLSIYGNGPRIEIRGEAADGNRVVGNFIGTDVSATEVSESPRLSHELWQSDSGVALVLGADRNEIGGPALADRNVFAGNDQWGIRINHGETSENVIENNIIGLSPDLSRSYTQKMGIDVQWWTWGNYITGNLISGHYWYGVDLSHSAIGNTVVNNRFGTGGDGNSGAEHTANKHGIAFKDNPTENYVGNNVIGNSLSHGLWHKHNYTGSNTIVGNRIGVGSDGADLGNGGYGVELRGHDDLYVDNIIAYNDEGGVLVTNTTGPAQNGYTLEKTLGNSFHQTTFYNTSFPYFDIESSGQNPNDSNDNDDGAHLLLNYPEVTGIGPGQVYGTTCSRCTVEVYVGGTVRSNGSLNPASSQRGKGAAWIGRAVANNRGVFSMADDLVAAGKNLMLITIDRNGNTSEISPRTRVPSSFNGSGSNAKANQGSVATPEAPARPPRYQPQTFDCNVNGSTLSWDNAGATEYYVFFSVGGDEGYVGPVRGTSVSVPAADSYRVEHWVRGFATNAQCAGDGVAQFSCSYQNGTLRWDDAGAEEYYAFATTGRNERYLGPVRSTSLATGQADSYRVEHWVTGRVTNAACAR